jgi:diguanylate cyclase (GGDEF)-like protein
LDRLQQTLVASARHQRSGALLFIDLDNFKALNDTLGHDMGDLLLQQVAEELTSCIRKSDTVARFGGDEFVVMLEGLSANRHHAATQVRRVGDKIHTRFNAPFVIAGHEYVGTASIGVTLFGARQETVEELLKQTDLAMYQAKAAGRNTLRFFDPGMQTALEARAVLEAELRVALRESQFLLFYQPQVDREGRMTGVEALVRWQHPERGLVLPDTFIELAEETGLIRPMGLWVLDTACRQLATWATRPETAGLSVAVNVSAREFGEPDFVDQVVRALERAGAEPRRLTLELTESLLLADLSAAIGKITALKAQGVGFSLDDFGTGYSSLSSLKQLPLDQLKIDQSFIKDLGTDPNDAAIVRAILALGRNLGLAVIAEGVETTAQRDLLAADGCQAFQGYLFGRPDSAAALRIETRADAC